ncbi:MAG: transglutaminase domain-containing protein, partial [Bacteroidota bacterium]
EKVQTIYNYILENIRYRSVAFLQSGLIPQKASTTISEKQGDCKDVSTLFVALCKTQGIDANLVLVNTRNNGHRQMMLPSIDFNHCIAKVALAGEEHFLELTSENLPFGVGGPSTHRTFVLDIPQQVEKTAQASILEPDNLLLDKVIRETEVSFSDGNMIVSKKSMKTGNAASSMRETYENIGADMQYKNMQEAINSEAPGVKLLEVAFQEGLNDNSPAIHYTYSYRIPDVFTDISDLKIFELPFADNLSNPSFLSTDERVYPIELWEYFGRDLEKESLSIEIPEGYTLADGMESETLETKNIRYQLDLKTEAGRLLITRQFELLDDIVLPEDYPDFKTTLEQVVKSDNRKIAFKKS